MLYFCSPRFLIFQFKTSIFPSFDSWYWVYSSIELNFEVSYIYSRLKNMVKNIQKQAEIEKCSRFVSQFRIFSMKKCMLYHNSGSESRSFWCNLEILAWRKISYSQGIYTLNSSKDTKKIRPNLVIEHWFFWHQDQNQPYRNTPFLGEKRGEILDVNFDNIF